MFKLEPLLPYSTSESAQFFHPHLDDFLVILPDIALKNSQSGARNPIFQ